MNVEQTIKKTIKIIENLEEKDVAKDAVYKVEGIFAEYPEEEGLCCLVGNIAEQFGCKVTREWEYGKVKPCLRDKFSDGYLAKFIDTVLSDLHIKYCDYWRMTHNWKPYMNLEWFTEREKISFEEMKKQAVNFLKGLLP